ncbi:putative phosphatase regulatory subunit-domain-containing protein [Sphaerosporella brunnea]|uniref:Putative phosphatase regulatory subunit-domain-containing protein n=1 Tax=Sphaerosporella brunnea TaxID=1250544 RepID=A0A5J5EC23_9PEZI|nr:putative phosphatase regulatory subunit-domain-containing protein [Sphaerosporella brunnea]
MPYTPPSQTPSASPSSSRSSSFSNHDPQNRGKLLDGPNPPRSTAYLNKHRRSSFGTTPPFQVPIVQPQTRERASSLTSLPTCSGVRQSPPPVSADCSVMPPQAISTPPDSTQNSSDEEDGVMRRGREQRDLGKLEDELKEAIMRIPQRRAPSPDGKSDVPLETSRGRSLHSHQRTRSDSHLIDIAITRTRSGSHSSSSLSDDMEDDAYRIAPPMVRKKSGEVVKSSLKSPSRSRPCSVPSTPTFPKNVHFDQTIEHVRHFLHSEKPSAVSVGSSPVEGVYDAESEYPFGYDDEPQWEIGLPNFPKDTESRKCLPVRLEKLCLSTDKKNLIGTVAVANLAFQKSVVSRFTFDYWQTVSEVTAEFSSDVRRREREDGIDRFVFKIKLAEQANLEKKILFFCIRYNTNGQEFWDNNNGVNFQVDFRKATPAGRHAGHQAQALPRSRPHSSQQQAARPRSMPNMDEFNTMFDEEFFKTQKMDRKSRPKQKVVVPVDEETELPSRRANPTGNAFGSRYDFRTSLNAAIKASGPQQPRPTPVLDLPVAPAMEHNTYFSMSVQNLKTSTFAAELASATPLDIPPISSAGPPELFSTENFWTHEDKPSIESPSYRELLDNYCFFGSSKATKAQPPPKPEPIKKQSTEKKIKESLHLLLPTGKERPGSPQYLASPLNGTSLTPPSLSLAQQKTSGNASPIPLNYAGYHHRRRGSGAFRFDTAQTSTAIC